jgi:hypothetical protein
LFAIFVIALAFNVIYSLRMSLPSLPDEFNTAAWSAYFSGFAEIPLLGGVPEGRGGWLTGFLFTPIYYLIDDPVTRFRCMLIMNSVFAALLPLLTYKITASLGLEKAWQRTMCAGVVAISMAAFAHTKFITAETLCVFFPLFLFALFISSTNTKNRAARFFLSFFAAITLALALATHSRLWTLVIAFILLVLYTKYILRVNAISFAGFFPAFAGFTVLQLYINEQLTGNLFTWSDGDAALYVEQLYRFAVSTWGAGVLGIVLCVFAFIRKDSPLPLKMFAFFALVYNTSMLFSDSASPLLVLFAFCYIFMHGLEFKKLLLTAITLGIIFLLYYSEASLPEVSAVFCVIALLFVLVSCAERYSRHIITFSLSLAFLYSVLHAAVVYLPNELRRAESENAEVLALSEYIYNSADAPPTYIINNAGLAPILRFLNRNTEIKTAADSGGIPDDCFVITRGETGELVFMPRGERAEAYIISQE